MVYDVREMNAIFIASILIFILSETGYRHTHAVISRGNQTRRRDARVWMRTVQRADLRQTTGRSLVIWIARAFVDFGLRLRSEPTLCTRLIRCKEWVRRMAFSRIQPVFFDQVCFIQRDCSDSGLAQTAASAASVVVVLCGNGFAIIVVKVKVNWRRFATCRMLASD